MLGVPLKNGSAVNAYVLFMGGDVVEWTMDSSPDRGAKWVVAFWAVADDRFLERVHQEWDEWSAQHSDQVMASGTRFPEWSALEPLPIDVGIGGLLQHAFAVRVVTDGRDLTWGQKALDDLMTRLAVNLHVPSQPNSQAALMVCMALWDEGVEVDGTACYLDPEPQSTGWTAWKIPGRDSLRTISLSRSDALRIVVRAYANSQGDEDINSPHVLAGVGEKALSYSRDLIPEHHAAWLAHQKEKVLEGTLVPGTPQFKKRF